MTPDIAHLLASIGVSGWLLAVVFVCCLIDGFFPPMPSETAVMGALTLAVASAAPPALIAGILAAASVGAAAGDSIAFLLGRRVGTERWAWMRRPRVHTALRWAREQVTARPAALILGARYIPVGRVAVNMTAGASGMRYRQFLPLSLLAALAWTLMCWLLSAVVAAWLGHQPLLAMAVSVAISIVLGLAVDAISRLVRARRQRATPEKPEAEDQSDTREAVGAVTPRQTRD